MLEHVFSHLYHYRNVKNASETDGNARKSIIPQEALQSMLPYCEGLQYVPDYPAFTDLSQMLFINSNLPGTQQNKWRFLFSSQIHGESFSTLLGKRVREEFVLRNVCWNFKRI